jgi:hypothetical protein
MCALRIDKLRQNPAKILLLWRHGEHNALGAHVPVECLDIGNSKSQIRLFLLDSCRKPGAERDQFRPSRTRSTPATRI